MEIIVAKNIGFCAGVKGAYNMSIRALAQEKSCQMFGHLVHNEKVIQELESRGLGFAFCVKDIKSKAVIIRAHGVGDKIIKELKNKKIKIIDATCPLVKKAQEFARELDKEGFQVIIVGDKGHAEVQAIGGVVLKKAIIIEKSKDIKKISLKSPIGIVVQTTQNYTEAIKIIEKLKKKFTQIKICNTFCPETSKRQQEIKELAKKADLILIIGSKKSANTQRMVKICKKMKSKAHGVEGIKDIKDKWFLGVKRVAIGSGTSTPEWLINDVLDYLEKIK